MIARSGCRALSRARVSAPGFTLIELVVVLSLVAIMLGVAALTMGGYFQRVAAERAAQVFAQDLTLARTWAVRSQEPVVIRFYESSLWYEVESRTTATQVARRRFGVNADIDLSSATLELPGDSLVFDVRGFADFSGVSGSLGTATFTSGLATYAVSFNSMGASRVDRS